MLNKEESEKIANRWFPAVMPWPDMPENWTMPTANDIPALIGDLGKLFRHNAALRTGLEELAEWGGELLDIKPYGTYLEDLKSPVNKIPVDNFKQSLAAAKVLLEGK